VTARLAAPAADQRSLGCVRLGDVVVTNVNEELGKSVAVIGQPHAYLQSRAGQLRSRPVFKRKYPIVRCDEGPWKHSSDAHVCNFARSISATVWRNLMQSSCTIRDVLLCVACLFNDLRVRPVSWKLLKILVSPSLTR
jgi:hypothetical protein